MNDIHLYEKIPLLENNFSVKFMEFYDKTSLASHWHEHIEFLYFLSGNCNFTCNGKTFSVKSNDFVVINSKETHAFETAESVNFFCIIIYPNFFYDINFNDKTILENIIHNDKHIQEIIKRMYGEYLGENINSDMVLKGCTYQLMAYLLRNYVTIQLSNKEFIQHSTKLERINKILIYISDHYYEKITNAHLAKLCCISEGHLCRIFKIHTGKSTTEYINNFRIEKAAILLSTTDESIANIAISTGFEDLNYFSRTFKKIKKIPPKQYRRNCK